MLGARAPSPAQRAPARLGCFSRFALNADEGVRVPSF